MHDHIPSLLVVLGAALAAPLLGELTRRFGLSIVVLELLLGVAIGPQGLGWASPDGAVPHVATIGMAFLFFLAGLEIDLAAIGGQPLARSIAGWLACFVLSLALAYAAHRMGWIDAWMVVGIALSTTALGVVVPMLRDAGLMEQPLGRFVMAVGVVGELGPILAMAILLSRNSTGLQAALTVGFIALILVLAWAIMKGVAVPGFLKVLRRTMTSSSQLPVRASVFILAALVVAAEQFGLDLALGALAAGMIVKLAAQDSPDHLLHHKLDAIGFGFLVPVFFIASGMTLDLKGVLGSGMGIAIALSVAVALLVVRVPLVFAHRGVLPGRQPLAVGLFSATTLSLIVALTQIAVANGAMEIREAGPLVMGGVLSVLVFPLVALAAAGKQGAPRSGAYTDHDGL